MLTNVKCQQMLSNVMFKNVNQFQPMLWNAIKCWQILANVNKIYQILANVKKCYQMETNVNKYWPMLTNVQECIYYKLVHFLPQPGTTRADFFPHFFFSFGALRVHSDTLYGLKLVHSALKAPTKPKPLNHCLRNRKNAKIRDFFMYLWPNFFPK